MYAWLLFFACAAPDAAHDPGVAGDTGQVSPDLVFGDPVACDAPLDHPTWTDVAAARGLTGSTQEEHTAGGTAVVVDLDGDGDLDIVVSYPQETRFYVREGGAYVMQSTPATRDVTLLTVSDIDADGRPDVLRGGGPPAVLGLVDGAVTSRYLINVGPDVEIPRAQGVFPSDIDGDGAIDLYAMQTASEIDDFVFWGNGDGTFTPDPDALPEGTRDRHGFDARWFDWDGDLDLDLYVVNDKGAEFGPNVLYENDGGVLVDASDRCACALARSAMGVDVGDCNGDGLPDLYVTISAGEALLRGVSDGSFVDTTVASGIPPLGLAEMGWGGVFVDLDNDADLEIFEALGDLWSADDPVDLRYDTPPRLLVEADGRFTDEAAAWGLAPSGSWRAVIPFDDNGDGVLDILLTDVVEVPRLFLSDGCTDAGWLEVEAPEGARVEVTAGGRTQTAWVTAKSGFGGSRPAGAHFGLGASQDVERLSILLPDGTEHLATVPFPARRRVSVGLSAPTE